LPLDRQQELAEKIAGQVARRALHGREHPGRPACTRRRGRWKYRLPIRPVAVGSERPEDQAGALWAMLDGLSIEDHDFLLNSVDQVVAHLCRREENSGISL